MNKLFYGVLLMTLSGFTLVNLSFILTIVGYALVYQGLQDLSLYYPEFQRLSNRALMILLITIFTSIITRFGVNLGLLGTALDMTRVVLGVYLFYRLYKTELKLMEAELSNLAVVERLYKVWKWGILTAILAAVTLMISISVLVYHLYTNDSYLLTVFIRSGDFNYLWNGLLTSIAALPVWLWGLVLISVVSFIILTGLKFAELFYLNQVRNDFNQHVRSINA